MTGAMLEEATIGCAVDLLPTPAVVIDRNIVNRNIASLHNDVLASGVRLRAHVKTHKTLELAKLQVAAGAGGLAAAKPSEAEPFARAGFQEIALPYPAIGIRARHIAELARRVEGLIAHVDSRRGVADLQGAAEAAGVHLRVRIEVDTGLNRSGVRTADQAVDLAHVIRSSSRLELDGIATHRSAFFPGHDGRDPHELGIEEGRLVVELAEKLRGRGVAVGSVAAGSTPTARGAARVRGVTEVCAGTYPLLDWGMSERGVCTPADIAVSIHCTVVSGRDNGTVTVDGGSKTFPRDTYGADGPFAVTPDRAARLEALTEEHGSLRYGDGEPPAAGERVVLHPIHVCPTINLVDRVHVAEHGVVRAVWSVVARGCTI